MSEQFVTTTKHFRKLLAAGYLLIVLLVGGIICTWLGEWRDLELLERENREINRFRKETHDAYVGVVELSQPPDSQAGAGDSANEQAGRAEETEEERFSRVVRQETGSTSDDDHHDALHTEP